MDPHIYVILLDHGADLEIKNNKGYKPKDYMNISNDYPRGGCKQRVCWHGSFTK